MGKMLLGKSYVFLAKVIMIIMKIVLKQVESDNRSRSLENVCISYE